MSLSLKLARSVVLNGRLPALAARSVRLSARAAPAFAAPRAFSSSILLRERAFARSADQTERTPEDDEPVPFSAPPVDDAAPKLFSSIQSALHAPVYRAVTEKPFKYETMSEVQAAVFSHLPRLSSSPTSTPLVATTENAAPSEIEQAQDLLVRAKTGTGKTLAFLIPALEGRLRALESFLANYKAENPSASAQEAKRALADFAKNSVGALVLSPTRELATQIANEAVALTTHLPQFGVRLLVGGASRSMQLREWMRSPSNDIVVATPGRMTDFLESEGAIRRPLANARMLILDEADTLLDMGFADDIAMVAEHLPAERQTFLFSATVSKSIREVARKSLKKDHLFIDTVRADDVDTHLHIPQFHTVLPSAKDQIEHIVRLIAHDQLLHATTAAQSGGVNGGKAVIFLPTTRMTQLFSQVLAACKNHLPYGRDTLLVEIHSKKSQEQRTRASDLFRRTKTGYSILITSDVSARGVDYPGVTRVIQVGVPTSRDIYIHRVGRTGRAGKAGRGDLVLLPWEAGFVANQMNDIPIKPISVAELQDELAQLASEYDASPPKLVPTDALKPAPSPRGQSRDRRNSARAPRAALPHAPVSPALSTLPESLHTNVLPAMDVLTTREVFASLLGYYLTKAHELRTTKDAVLSGLKEWATGAMGLEEEPYVSREFLAKLGMNDRSSSSRRGGRSRSFGGNDRGGRFERDRDGDRDRDFRPKRRDSFGGSERRERDRDERRSFDRRDRSSSAPPSYNNPARSADREHDFDRRDRGPAPRRQSAGFGYGSGSMYGSDDADAWEKPARKGRY